jgi:putative Mn2+ efflux pump MntP
MKVLDEELLYLASENTLVNLKADATELLKSYHETETIITNKSTSLLQVLFPVFVGIFGYILVEIQTKSNPKLFWFACIEEIVIFLSCYYLFESLYLKKIALSGVKPSNILHDDIIKNDQTENTLQYLRLRVFGLQNAITACEASHDKRKTNFKNALNIIMIGTSIVVVVFSLVLIGQTLFLHK